MTAAHCTMDMQATDKITIFYNTTANPVTGPAPTAISVTADRYVQHPAFDRNTLDNDMTLVHLPTPIRFGRNVQPECLPFSLVNMDVSGKNVAAAGWGTTQQVAAGQQNNGQVSPNLLRVDLPVLTTAQCQQYYGASRITNNMICTYNPGKDTCQGDSGGSIDYLNPANNLNYAIGVVSFGVGCASTGYPGVYAKVVNYLPWIETTTADTFCKL
jgi:transmembrane serine protease 9